MLISKAQCVSTHLDQSTRINSSYKLTVYLHAAIATSSVISTLVFWGGLKLQCARHLTSDASLDLVPPHVSCRLKIYDHYSYRRMMKEASQTTPRDSAS
ncbi:Putative protein of unknown function [Podospora comata]|uniref:Uncharacterized protein n=1 Tax=Podospora comata TaxID=48703 RepID=A0ABY6RTX4_PODCO|nr:Putative protein of unknown function [Podospora comata]